MKSALSLNMNVFLTRFMRENARFLRTLGLGLGAAGLLFFARSSQALLLWCALVMILLFFAKRWRIHARGFGFTLLLALLLAAPLLARIDALVQVAAGEAGPLGLDQHGRDWFARLLQGHRDSILPAALGAAGALVLAVPLGAFPVFWGSRFRRLWLLALQVQTAVPPLLPILVMLAFFHERQGILIPLFAFVFWPEGARMIQAELERILQSDFVAFARLQGLSESQVFWRELMPFMRPLLLSFYRITLLNALLLEAVLGYLGLGRALEKPSLGGILSQGFRLIDRQFAPFAAALALLMAWLFLLKPQKAESLKPD